MTAPAADQSGATLSAFFGNLVGATLETLGDAYDAGALGGSALAQITAECQEQAVVPEFDLIRSRVNMSMTGANPAPFMLANMEVPTPAERIQAPLAIRRPPPRIVNSAVVLKTQRERRMV